MIDFLEAMRLRVEDLVKETDHRPLSVLLSGGSVSTFILQAWARFAPPEINRRAVYIQFDHFNWLERENARQVAAECGFDLVEISISEKPFLNLSGPQGFDRDRFWNLVLCENRILETGTLITGFGWPELICERDAETGKCDLREQVFLRSQGNDNCIDFFDRSKPSEWRAFRSDPHVQLFESLIDEIPFPSVRYWQDFVFQKHVSSFTPCPAWKIEECLGFV